MCPPQWERVLADASPHTCNSTCAERTSTTRHRRPHQPLPGLLPWACLQSSHVQTKSILRLLSASHSAAHTPVSEPVRTAVNRPRTLGAQVWRNGRAVLCCAAALLLWLPAQGWAGCGQYVMCFESLSVSELLCACPHLANVRGCGAYTCHQQAEARRDVAAPAPDEALRLVRLPSVRRLPHFYHLACRTPLSCPCSSRCPADGRHGGLALPAGGGLLVARAWYARSRAGGATRGRQADHRAAEATRAER